MTAENYRRGVGGSRRGSAWGLELASADEAGVSASLLCRGERREKDPQAAGENMQKTIAATRPVV
jgi:hypothetical protein